jgi:methyl-accepting chemotaxis protein
MANLRIGTRLLIGFGVIVLLTVILGVFALTEQGWLQAFADQMTSRDFASLGALRSIASTEDQMRATRALALLSGTLRRNHLPAESPEGLERRWLQYRDQIAKQLSDLESTVGSWEATATTSQRRAAWSRVRGTLRDSAEALKLVSPEVERQFALINDSNIPEAVARISSVDQAVANFQSRIAESQRAAEDQTRLGHAEVEAIAKQTQSSVVLVLVITALAGIVFALFIQRSISTPLEQFATVVERVGQGDLTQKVDVSRKDELGDLGRSLDRMVRSLRAVATQTRAVGENLSAATVEILATTRQQAASTAEQAAAVQQANATMAEISQSGVQISERAKQVAATAQATSSASSAGLQSVRNTTAIMESIRQQAEAVAENVIALSEKTQAVSEIISSVNDISEQSHLLALNAAIQAALAGEHGRSFSVVAREMKDLADQSKQATMQVRSILGDIQKAISSSVMLTEEAVKRVESGRQQADVADRTIRELTENIGESVRAFQQIVGGSSQQQIGFEQVTEAFRNIGIASQETASGTKQSEKAAANLNALAQQLRSAVARYQV